MVVIFWRDAMGKCIRTIITIVVLAVAIAFAIPVQAHAVTSDYTISGYAMGVVV